MGRDDRWPSWSPVGNAMTGRCSSTPSRTSTSPATRQEPEQRQRRCWPIEATPPPVTVPTYAPVASRPSSRRRAIRSLPANARAPRAEDHPAWTLRLTRVATSWNAPSATSSSGVASPLATTNWPPPTAQLSYSTLLRAGSSSNWETCPSPLGWIFGGVSGDLCHESNNYDP